MAQHSSKTNVLVTGAYGLIGNLVYQHLAAQPDRYNVFGTSRRMQASSRATKMDYNKISPERLRLADLTDFDSVRRTVEGMDTIVHMAADASGEAGWESVLQSNIIGAYNIFEASRQAGVKRVVFASSNQVVFGYLDKEFYRSVFAKENPKLTPDQIQRIDHTRPTRPLNEYACSKVFGEALAHMYAFTYGLSCIVLRIGWVLSDDTPPYPGAQMLWCSQRDCVQMVECCINTTDDLRFDIFFVQSDNAYNIVDIQHAKNTLGYTPQDRAEDYLK
ncbi:MAG: NAD(P)-dependent oxidoreductase [Anaerolineaceae bacterium]|nr:NAD(P)-dependent oxidoreductase [Anaerolineaceae bacterium]